MTGPDWKAAGAPAPEGAIPVVIQLNEPLPKGGGGNTLAMLILIGFFFTWATL